MWVMTALGAVGRQVRWLGGAFALLDLLATGALPRAGLIRQEDIPLPLFLANRFGRVFAGESTALPLGQVA